MSRKIKWLVPEVIKGDYQYYRQWITAAWERAGGKLYDMKYIDLNIRFFLGRFNVLASLVPDSVKSDEAVVVLCGAHPNFLAFPLMYTHELIPIIWDCWPKLQKTAITSMKQNKIRTCFCTSSQTRDLLQKECPGLNVYWLPEGIDISCYKCEKKLKSRKIDVLEMGRQLPSLHSSLVDYNGLNPINHQYSKPGELLFKTFDDLTEGLADAKITICYPRCDTHPEMAGNIETLTQRYWECMLSGTLIVGRAPKELIYFCGYNPMVDLKENSAQEIADILLHIEDYQPLVDRNLVFARENASWDSRMPFIKDTLKDLGYEL